MTSVFYRSVSDGWRVGLAESLDGAKVLVHDGAMEETVVSSDIFIPELSGEAGDVAPLFHMGDYPWVFLAKRDAALMSPTPLVGVPPLIQLLRHRAANDEFTTNVGGNFSLLLGEGSLLDVDSPGYDTILKAVFAWRGGGHQRQVVVSCGNAQPNLLGDLVEACCAIFGATVAQRKMFLAGIRVISAFTTTIAQRQMCYLQAHVSSRAKKGEEEKEELQGVCVECNHMFTSGIGDNNAFKIFSYVLYGLSDEEREELLFNRQQRDFVCQSNIKDEHLVLRLQEEYLVFVQAMQTLGISPAIQRTLFRQVAVVIHLTEMEFYSDGSLATVPALKNVARLCQLDYEECLHFFSSREACVAAARLLYHATFMSVLRRINSVFNLSDESTPLHPSVTILAMPPLSFEGSDKLENIVLSAMYENLLQAFLRSSDREVVRWQSAGVRVPEGLQAVMDTSNNYGLLKVMYGPAGVLSAGRTAHRPDSLESMLTNCARSGHVTFNTSTRMLSVRHFFGTRRYQFPCNAEEVTRLKTVHHADFEPLRSFLIENADMNTREALRLFAQLEDNVSEQVVALEMLHVRPLLEMLQDANNTFWWIGSIDLGAVFDGNSVERQMRELPVFCATELRRHLPHRYITCRSDFIVSTFQSLLPPEKTRTNNTQEIARTILQSCGATYHVTQDGFLVDGEALFEMSLRVKTQMHRHATLIQAFARCSFCAIACKRRVAAWLALIGDAESRRRRAAEESRCHARGGSLRHPQLLRLMEEESAARSTLREECWDNCIALQRAFQEKMESFLVRRVASSIKGEEKRLSLAFRSNQNEKFQMIQEHIQQRLEKHRARLDGVVEAQLGGERSLVSAEKLTKVHEHFLSDLRKKEQQRKKLEDTMARRFSRIQALEEEREKKTEERRQRTRLRHEKNQIAREQLRLAQEDFNDTLALQTMLCDMESKVTRRVKDEALAFRRQKTERLMLRLQEDRKRREDAIIRSAKVGEQKSAQRELRLRQAKEAEERRKRHERRLQLDMQARERQSTERLRTAREQTRQSVARTLARTGSNFAKLSLYEHHSGQKAVRTRSCSRGPSEALVLTNGNKTYSRMLSESSLRGLFEYHATKPRAKSPYPHAALQSKRATASLWADLLV